MKKYALIIITFYLLHACIDPYKVEIEASKAYYIINGTLTNSIDPQIISVFITNDAAKFKSSQFTATISPKPTDVVPVSSAVVTVSENGQNTYNLIEIEPGYYQMPTGFVGKIGATYKLTVKTNDGKTLESTSEKMLAVPEIKGYRDVYNEKGIIDRQSSSGKIASSDIYIDYDDPAKESNFYQWKWTSYETQVICQSCRQGYYNRANNNPTTPGNCVTVPELPIDLFYDYYCEALCWDVLISNKIDIFSDIYTDGLPQRNKLIAQIPLYQSNPCLVVLEQYALNANAFRYLKLVNDQSVNTGTLADTPPAPIKGNVSNINNPTEIILGYFTAAGMAEIRYMMDRKNTRGAAYNGLFKYQNGRGIQVEEPSLFRPFIPLAICKKSNSRTPTAPRGWQFGSR